MPDGGKQMASPPAPHPRMNDEKKDVVLCAAVPALSCTHPGSARTAMCTVSWPQPSHTCTPLTRTRSTHRTQGAIECARQGTARQ